ncbi:MAG: hypothetical protein R3195_14280 [Gemmatimonadota bacterium]|nr:hypothetical protein [Gemmatimonadota bacterium]
MRSPLLPALALAVAASIFAPAPASAQGWRDFRVARQAGDIESLDVELLYGAGRLSVEPSGAPFLYDARVRYDTERFQPVRAWEVDGGHGRFRLALTSVDDETSSATVRLEDWDVDFDLEDLRDSGNELGELEFELHPRIPTRLRLGIGAARSRLELGGLSLSSLEILTGASETDLAFSEPNRVSMSELVLKAGAADFEAEGLGNARFERLEFKGAIGDVSLDFSGEWTRDATANITMGVGELAIRIPEEIAVRIVRSSLLIKLDAPGFERVDRSYVTPNWDTAEIHLEIELEAAFGTVEVERF